MVWLIIRLNSVHQINLPDHWGTMCEPKAAVPCKVSWHGSLAITFIPKQNLFFPWDGSVLEKLGFTWVPSWGKATLYWSRPPSYPKRSNRKPNRRIIYPKKLGCEHRLEEHRCRHEFSIQIFDFKSCGVMKNNSSFELGSPNLPCGLCHQAHVVKAASSDSISAALKCPG